MKRRQIAFIIGSLFLYGSYSYSGYRIFLVALIVIILLALASFLELRWVRSRLTLNQTLEPDPVYTGDAAHLVVEIQCRTRLPIAVLEIVTEQKRADALQPVCPPEPDGPAAALSGRLPAPSSEANPPAERAAAKIRRSLARQGRRLLCRLRLLPQPDEQKRAQPILRHHRLTSLIGRGRFRETIRLFTDDARIYEVSACQVSIQDPFGLFRLPLNCLTAGAREGLRLHVLPRPDDRLLALEWLHNNRDGFTASQSLSDEVNAVADLHQMNPGDSLKRIHWIISAKQNQWMIKRFEKDEQAHVLVLPDLGEIQLPERLRVLRRDAVLRLAAASVQQMLQSEMTVLLVTSDQRLHSSFATRNDQLLDLLIHLAAAPDRSADPLRQLALEGLARLPDDAMVVFVTAAPDENLAALAADLEKTGHRVFVILYENPLLAAPDQARRLERLANSGARLIRIAEKNPARLRHLERLGTIRKSTDGWRRVRRGTPS